MSYEVYVVGTPNTNLEDCDVLANIDPVCPANISISDFIYQTKVVNSLMIFSLNEFMDFCNNQGTLEAEEKLSDFFWVCIEKLL